MNIIVLTAKYKAAANRHIPTAVKSLPVNLMLNGKEKIIDVLPDWNYYNLIIRIIIINTKV